jgi:alpha-L-rhamnosidase
MTERKVTQMDIPSGFYPFWFWNGRLSRDEIRWQVEQMAAQGMRGFFIHSRQGLAQPYLSEAFFEMVDAAIQAAEEHGLLVHLYDENPYPGGIAGGQTVLGNPHYYATELVQQTYVVAGGPVRIELPPGKVLSAMAYPLRDNQVDWSSGADLSSHIGTVLSVSSYNETGLTRYNQKRYFASRPTPVLEVTLPDKPYKIMVSVQVEVDRFKYWGHYVDALNPDAVRRFISLTHERYRERYEDKFGKTIISIFDDETAPGWSDRIPAAFQAKYGYDLCDYMPALQDASHPDHVRVSYDLHCLTYKLFCNAFDRPLSEWCRAHGLMYSGEKSSLRMSQLRWMDIPGCEPGHTKAGAHMDLAQPRLRGNAKATASAAYVYGKIGALDECYHSLGWGATLQDAKLIADGALLMGIKYLVPHGLFYTTHALKKHDAPPSFFFQMPYWPLFGKLAAHVEQVGRLFENTYIDAQILVIEPSSGVPTAADQDAYARLLAMLMENHLDFHFADTDVLIGSAMEGDVLCVRDLRINLIIVPPMQVIEPPLVDWLERWQNAGGRVIYCASDSEQDDVLRRIREVVKPSLSVQSGGREIAAIQVAKRSGAGKTLWFALNTSNQKLNVEFDAGGLLQEIPLEDHTPCLEMRNGRYMREVHPFESLVLEASQVDGTIERLPVIHVPLGGQARLRPENKNLLRMNEWRMSLLDADGSPLQTAVVPALPICHQLEKGSLRFAPVVRHMFGNAPQLDWPLLRVRYEHVFESQYVGPVELVIEPDSIVGDWRMWVNGRRTFGPQDLALTTAHVRGSLGKDITADLQPGENVLAVELETNRSDGGLLNPLYLAGDFGVELNPVRLVPGVQIGGLETYEENKLPFYSGTIEYDMSFELLSLPPGPRVVLQLDFEAPFHEASEVSINGGEWRVVAWSPRRIELDVEQLNLGTNTLRIKVYTTLIRSFEGQWFDARRHRYQAI